MSDTDQKQSSTEVSSTDSNNDWIDNEIKALNFELMMAEEIWLKVKGYPIPESYSTLDRISIFQRYYHRAVSQSQGE